MPSSAFAASAEILTRAGADAVVAHLWSIRADVARICSTELYRSLTSANRSDGDIAVGINDARRAILDTFDGSAEAFSPVLYLRSPATVLFDFKGRKVAPPAPSLAAKILASGVDSASHGYSTSLSPCCSAIVSRSSARRSRAFVTSSRKSSLESRSRPPTHYP